MDDLTDCLDVLAHYPGDFRPEQIEPLGSAGGFSGSRLWRIKTPDRVLCLKCWPPESPTEEGLLFIHAVLLHMSRLGLDIVPVPCPDRLGRTVIRHQDRLWELVPWLPGHADLARDSTPAKAAAAMRVLAELHRAAATFAGHAPRVGRSPGIRERLDRVRAYAAGGLDGLRAHIIPEVWPELYDRVQAAVSFARREIGPLGVLLETAGAWVAPLQICIRDARPDHVLFTGDRVTGWIDFGALGIESVAADIARLQRVGLQGYPGGMHDGRPRPSCPANPTTLDGLGGPSYMGETLSGQLQAAYEAVRPLDDRERALVEVFDRSGVLLGALNWIEWLYRDRRAFRDPAAVARRLNEVLARLENRQSVARSASDERADTRLWHPNE